MRASLTCILFASILHLKMGRLLFSVVTQHILSTSNLFHGYVFCLVFCDRPIERAGLGREVLLGLGFFTLIVNLCSVYKDYSRFGRVFSRFNRHPPRVDSNLATFGFY